MASPVYALPLYPVFHDLSGQPLDGGYIYIGQVGQSAEAAPLQVFWDDAKTQPIAQPVRTINGYPSRNGSQGAIYVDGDYSITVRDNRRRLVYTALEGVNFAQAASERAEAAAAILESVTYRSAFTITTVPYQQTYPLGFNRGGDLLDVVLNTASLSYNVHYTLENNNITLIQPIEQGGDLLEIKSIALGMLTPVPVSSSVDVTPGRLMTVGYGGNTGAVQPPVATDLNDLITQHRRVRTLVGTTLNAPDATSTWLVDVIPNNGVAAQIATRIAPFDVRPAMMIRHSNGGVWRAWVELQAVLAGSTANRTLTGLIPGLMYFDTTLNRPIWRNAANTGWVDATGTAV